MSIKWIITGCFVCCCIWALFVAADKNKMRLEAEFERITEESQQSEDQLVTANERLNTEKENLNTTKQTITELNSSIARLESELRSIRDSEEISVGRTVKFQKNLNSKNKE